MRSINISPALVILSLVAGLMFFLGLYTDSLGLRSLAILVLCTTITAIFILPTKWSIIFAFVYIGFEGFFKIVSNYHPLVHIGSDIIVISIYLKLLVQVLVGRKQIPDKFAPLQVLFAIHFAWLLVVMFNPYALSIYSSIAGAKIYASMVSLYFLGYHYSTNTKDVRHFMWTFVIIALVHMLFAFYQMWIGPESVLDLHPRYAIQLEKYKNFAFRPFGLTNLPGAPAVFNYIMLPFLLYFIFHYRSWLVKIGLGLLLPLCGFLLMICQIRSAIIKVIFSFLIFTVGLLIASKRKSKLSLSPMLLVGAVIFGSAVYALPMITSLSSMPSSDTGRAFERSLTVFDISAVSGARRGGWDRFTLYAEKVPFGAGFSRVGAAAGAFAHLLQKDKHFGPNFFFADNFWLACLVEIGIPGMLIMTLLLLLILYTGISAWWKQVNSEIGLLQLTVLASLLSITLGLYGAEGILYNPESSFFWFFAGVLMKLKEFDSTNVSY